MARMAKRLSRIKSRGRLWLAVLLCCYPVRAETLRAIVEVEEDVYSYQPANNGAGPMWCFGNSCVVRCGDRVLVSGLETVPDAMPLNNCLPVLWERTAEGWVVRYRDSQRTREPCPLVALPPRSVLMSHNPTRSPPDLYSGPAQPQLLVFAASNLEQVPAVDVPRWDGSPAFTEHSYRSCAADSDHGELILFQNIGYDHAEWTFRDRQGAWSAQGRLVWPWGAEYDQPQPIRLCYATVALKNRAVYFCAVSDIAEPYAVWRDYKHQLTGQQWDYDFRRLFYTWSDDITTGKFHDWVEISSRDKTCGWIFPNDLHVHPDGQVAVLWTERALDERLQAQFFPDAKQRHSLEYVNIRDGIIGGRQVLVEGGDALGGLRPGRGRFHVTEDRRVFVFYHVAGQDAEGRTISENRLTEISSAGAPCETLTVALEQPLSSFFVATTRAGCQPCQRLDLLGDLGGTMRYCCIRLDSE